MPRVLHRNTLLRAWGLCQTLLPALLVSASACHGPPYETHGFDPSAGHPPCLTEVDHFDGGDPLIFDLAWSPDGTKLLSGGSNTLRLFGVSDEGALSFLDSVRSPNRFNSVQWSSDGAYAFAPTETRIGVYAVDEDHGLTLLSSEPEHQNYLQRIAVSPGGTQLLSCDVGGVTRLYDLAFSPPTLVQRAELAVHRRCTRVAWSPSGTMALSTGYDGGVVLYRIGADSLAVADHFQMQEQSGEAIFGRSDSEVVAGSFGFLNTLLRFHVDVEAGKFEVMQSMDLHQSGIGALEWSHSGDYLISGAHDHSTYIFEPVADDSELQLASSQEDKGDGVHSARWSPDDRFVAQTSSKRDLLQVLEVLPCR